MSFDRGITRSQRGGSEQRQEGRVFPAFRIRHMEIEIPPFLSCLGMGQVIDVEIEMAGTGGGFEHIGDTVNYERIVGHAKTLAAEGHFKLVETFAERLAHACLQDPLAARVRVRVEKPEALAPAAEAAGVELVVTR